MKVFIISAPSGSGKSTLVNEVRKLIPGMEFSISYTTRDPRGSEQDGREYHFITRQEFGNCYGTARRFLHEAEQRGHDLLLDIDVQGAEQIKSKMPDAVSIFILPPGRDSLEFRLRNRGQDSEEVIQRRLATATREIENYGKYDYILINDRLDESIEALKSILLAERRRRSGAEQSADETYTARAERFRLDNVRERVKPILASFVPAAAPGRR